MPSVLRAQVFSGSSSNRLDLESSLVYIFNTNIKKTVLRCRVVRRDGLVADDDRGDAIKIEILEAHCEPEIAFFQEDKPCSPLMFNKFALVGSVRARTTLSPEDT